jgi:hypothetical protein
MTAIKRVQYDLYALLHSEGFSAGTDEQLTEVVEGLAIE